MNNILQIKRIGDPVLRTKAKEVLPGKTQTRNIRGLIRDMIYTCDKLGETCLTAPEVGHLLRIMVMLPTDTDDRIRSAVVMINPTMKPLNGLSIEWESCPCIPDSYAMMPRVKTIDASWEVGSNRIITRRFTGEMARAFQHGLDHLNGVLFTDWVSTDDLVTKEEYLRRTAEDPRRLKTLERMGLTG